MTWKETTIGELGRVITGKTPKTKVREFYDGEYPFITPSDIGYNHYVCRHTETTVTDRARDRLRNQFIPPGAVLVTCIGNTIGKIAIAATESLTNQQMNSIIVNAEHDPTFVYYLMCQNVGMIRSVGLGGGAAQPIINKSTFSSLKVRTPRVKDEETAIAEMLSVYDEFIVNNQRRIDLLEQSARLLFREWFVWLRYPGHEHDKIVEGVPGGWERKQLGDLFELCYGKGLPEQRRESGPVRVYGSSGEVGTHSSKLIDGPGIIVGRKGNVGSVFWVDVNFWPIDTVYYVEPGKVSLFNYHLLQTLNFQNSDAAVPGLNREYAYSIKVLKPSRSLIDEFEEFAASVFAQRRCLLGQNAKLGRARDLLLPRLMDGRLSV